MNTLQIYLWLKLDSIQPILILFGFLLTTISAIATFTLAKEEIKEYKPFLILIISIPMLIIGVLMPNSKQFAIMYLAPKITQQKNIDFISSESKEMYRMFKDYIKNLINEE